MRCLLFGPAALEEVILASALPSFLKRRWPDLQIAWLLEEPFADLMAPHPEVDTILTLPHRRWQELWRGGRWSQIGRELWQRLREIGWRRFDLAILLDDPLWGELLALIASSRRLGFEGGWFLTEEVTKRPSPWFAARYRRLLDRLGIPSSDYRPEIFPSEEIGAELGERLRRWRLFSRPYILLTPAPPLPFWSRLARLLFERFGWQTLVFGERQRAMAIAARAGGAALPLTQPLSPAELAVLVDRSRAVVTGQLALCYLALSLGKPVAHIGPLPLPAKLPPSQKPLLQNPPSPESIVEAFQAEWAPATIGIG